MCLTMESSIPIDDGSTRSTRPKQSNSTPDHGMAKSHLEAFLHNTEDPFIVGMTTRAGEHGKPGMPATLVTEPKFWRGKWVRRST
jgi:hypothetical protein